MEKHMLLKKYTLLRISKQNPWLGVGPGNMQKEINKQVGNGEVRVEITHGHVHNAYFEVIGTQGAVGLLALLLMLFYPLYVFVHNKQYDRRIAGLGIILMGGFMIFSLTEIPFIHDNFSSIFLTFLSVFFAWIMHAKYNQRAA